jgi:parallel beta-helix repeat protein
VKKKFIGILLALVLVLSLGSVMGVAADNNDPVYNVDQETYHATIQDAADEAEAGDTIKVAAGTYDLDSSIRVTNSVSIIGDIDNPQNVVINAGTIPLDSGPKPPDRDKDGFQVAADGVIIKGFKIINAISVLEGPGDGWQNAGITVGGDITLIDWLDPYDEPILIDGGTFSNNIIENCTHGIYLGMARNVIVSDNIIRNITTDRPGADGEGIIVWGTKHWGEGNYQDPTGDIIEGNLIEDCERIGICLGAWDPDHFSVSGTVIRNNTIRNSGLWGIALMYIEGPVAITGNDIYSNSTGIGVGPEVPGARAHFNNIHNNTFYGANVWDWTETASLDATNNWWGHASGPGGEHGRTNPAGRIVGKGDAVSENVDWDPWLHQLVRTNPAGKDLPPR